MTLSKERSANLKSAFGNDGINTSVDQLIEQVKTLYLTDSIPWVVGYSGGKDSTATLQLVWLAVSQLPEHKRNKPVHVISTDTLVENPVVALWVTRSLKVMEEAAKDQNLPIRSHRLLPELKDRYWVNLIGRGYPAPRPKFRWCTSRLKINPSNKFILDLAEQNGEAILVLGTRKAESSVRAANMKKYEAASSRDLLSAHGQLDRSWVYTPIASWSNDDVWLFLNQYKNPWGYTNKNLLGMYQGATEDGECPLVVDTSTPSCGDSRFGCYVCTLVEKDKSMHAMIQNDEEKEWMLPMMEFRNKWLDVKNDRSNRDFRKMDGSLMVHNDRLVHGPYKPEYRESMLGALLEAQQAATELAPDDVGQLEMITLDELDEIRRIWVIEKHEIEDRLPEIYESVVGGAYPGKALVINNAIDNESLQELRSLCDEYGDEDGVRYQMIRELLHVEQEYRTMARRAGLYPALERAIERGAFDNEADAEEFGLRRRAALDRMPSVNDSDQNGGPRSEVGS
jgi:DNA sulfur modification protein DndC